MATNTKLVRNLRDQLSLNQKQRAILIGTILGDGYIAGNFKGKNFRLRVEHCERQKDYVFWKYSIFQEWVLSPPKYRKKTNSWYFRTISHPEITEMRKLFYQDGRKKIPKNIFSLLKNPLTLAIWFMDDGAMMKRRGCIINTQSYSYLENVKLKECLIINFNLTVSLNRDKENFRLYIHKKSVPGLKKLIDKFMLPFMKYKFPVTP